MNQRKIGIVLSYVNIFFSTAIGFLYVPILLHYVGKNGYGLYQLIGSLIAYLNIMDFGMTAAIIRFYAKYKALKDKVGMENILAISLYGYAGITMFILLIGAICYFNIDFIFKASMTPGELIEARQMFLLLLVNIAISFSTMTFRAVIDAYQRFLFLRTLETIQLIFQPVLVVLILQKYPTVLSVAIVQTGLNIILTLARIYYCYKKLHIIIRFHYWNNELFADFRKLALSVFIVSLINQVFWKTNQLILGVVQGTGAVAVYSVASLIYINYMALSVAISGVYLPHITELVAKKRPLEELSNLFIKIGRWQYYLLALVITGFILFGQEFIEIWVGKNFLNAYWITIIIILPFTIELIQNIGQSILQAMNRYDFRAKVYLVTGILNILLAIPLGIKYSGIGCAIATGFSMLISNGFIMNFYYSRQIGLNIRGFWWQIGRITLVVILSMVLGYGINIFIPLTGKIGLISKIVFYTLLYGIFVYSIAMKADERLKVAEIIRKIYYKTKTCLIYKISR